MTTVLVLAVIAYLIGSISFAVIVSRVFALPDPRSYGSKNPGATNVMRTGRRAAALLTLFGDGAKGWLAVFLAARFAEAGAAETTMAVAAVAVVLGHAYPVFFGFRGGKGVSTALGVLLAINLYVALGAVASWLVILAFFRISSLSALVSAAFAPFFTLILYNPAHPYFIAVGVVSALLVVRHAPNIRNLLSGTEGRLGRSKNV